MLSLVNETYIVNWSGDFLQNARNIKKQKQKGVHCYGYLALKNGKSLSFCSER